MYPRLVREKDALRPGCTTRRLPKTPFTEAPAKSKDCPVFLKWEAERSLARLYEDEKQTDSCRPRTPNRAGHLSKPRAPNLEHEDSLAAVPDQRLPHLRRLPQLRSPGQDSRGLAGRRLQPRPHPSRRPRSFDQGNFLLALSRSMPSKSRRGAGGTVLFYWLGEKQFHTCGRSLPEDRAVSATAFRGNQGPGRALSKSHRRPARVFADRERRWRRALSHPCRTSEGSLATESCQERARQERPRQDRPTNDRQSLRRPRRHPEQSELRNPARS